MDVKWETIATRVKYGAAFLDRALPQWEKRLARPLNLASTRDCVLAQLFGRFRDGAKELVLNDFQTHFFGFRACSSELGNDINKYPPFYKLLTEAWNAEVQKRLA